jgi:hypothetical protein
MCAKKTKKEIDKTLPASDNKAIKRKTQKEEINDEIELLLKTLKIRKKN